MNGTNPKIRLAAVVAGLAFCAGVSTAQVPVDNGIRMSFGVPGGADLVDPMTGLSTLITGLSINGAQINAGAIDPVNGDVLLGGINSSGGVSNGQVRRVTLTGSAVLTETFIVDVNATSTSLKSIDFDRNGDIYTCDVNAAYRISRATGMSTTLFTNTFSGTLNALCIDMVAHKAWIGTFTGGVLIEHDIASGTTTQLGVASVAGFDNQISGLDDDGSGVLYVTTFNAAGQSVYKFDTNTNLFSAQPGAPLVGLNDAWYNRKDGMVHLVGAGANDDYYILDPVAGTNVQVTFAASTGTPANVAVNDFTGRTEFFPQRPTAGVPFTFEAAAHGGAGDIGIIAIVAVNAIPNFIQLAAGICDSGGFFPTTLAVPGVGPAGTTITIQTATINLAVPSLLIGNPLNMVFQ